MRVSGLFVPQRNKLPNKIGLYANCVSHLEFKQMGLSDIEKIRPLLGCNEYRTCDFTIGGLLMWVDYFNYEYCVYEDTLFIKGISENHPGKVAFSMPIGRLPLNESIALIVDYCNDNGIEPSFSAVPAAKAEDIAAITGGVVEPLEGWSDYLYDVRSLATLQGKAYPKKRNHVNRFMIENPNYGFEMITSRNIGEAMAFLDTVDLDGKADQAVASYELEQCRSVLSNIDTYLFDGALLRAEDGAVCAITLGEVVGDTLYVHIEKMDHNVAGAGETVNKLFAAEMLSRNCGLRYVNREEDMNDPGLRFAKESYHPVSLLDKCNVI